jgi:hypothetical protein
VGESADRAHVAESRCADFYSGGGRQPISIR